MLKNKRFIISILMLIIFLFTTTGYALYGKTLEITGLSKVKKNGIVEITNVQLIDSSNVKSNNTTYEGTNIKLDLSFNNNGQDAEYYATYEVTMENNSFYYYEFTSTNLDSNIDATSSNVKVSFQLLNMSEGDTIKSGQTKTFQVKIIATLLDEVEGDINVQGDLTNDLEQENVGSLIGSLTGNTSGDLTGTGKSARFNAELVNTFEYNKNFTLSLSNSSHFNITNCNGNDLGTMTINSNSTNNYNFCVERKSNVEFATSPQQVSVILKSANVPDTSIGTISLAVDINQAIDDHEAPIISNVTVNKHTQKGSVTLSWDGNDDNSIENYKILVYEKQNGSYLSPTTITTQVNNYTFDNINETTYYFVVYGIDELENTATQEEIDSATTSSGHASKTNEVSFRWTYNVDTSGLDGITSNGASTVLEGATYTTTLRASTLRELPSSIEIKMGGVTLTQGSQYSYNSNNGSVSIPNVTGDISISGRSEGCLVEGTKILLANGKTKKIENITYKDLLKVWSYDEGKMSYEYPIWIEKKRKSNKYIEITFEDNTNLKIVSKHGLYSIKEKRFISTADENFKVGIVVAKIKNNKIKPLRVIKIEEKEETVNYYHIVSTRYYNVIANNILTTDDEVTLSNLYQFDDNIKWIDRKEVLKDKNNSYNYSDFKDTVPYYLYKGLRVGEIKYLINQGYLTKNDFINYLANNQMNLNMYKKPITKKNTRYWMVTTSLDKVKKKDKYLKKEGSLYKLPKAKTKCFYNTADDKCYKPGDKVKVYTGMHFIKK